MKKLMISSVVVSLVLAWTATGAALGQVAPEDFNKLKARVDDLERASKTQSDDLAAIRSELAAIRKLLTQAADQLNVVSARLTDTDLKLRDLYRQDPSNPNRQMVDLLGNMDRSPAFRADVDKITTGRLLIDNPTGVDQYLYINGTLWRVIPGRSFAPVSRGPVTVQLPGGGSQVLTDWQFDAARGYVVAYRYPQTVVAMTPVLLVP